jgi:hypothetical protein
MQIALKKWYRGNTAATFPQYSPKGIAFNGRKMMVATGGGYRYLRASDGSGADLTPDNFDPRFPLNAREVAYHGSHLWVNDFVKGVWRTHVDDDFSGGGWTVNLSGTPLYGGLPFEWGGVGKGHGRMIFDGMYMWIADFFPFTTVNLQMATPWPA